MSNVYLMPSTLGPRKARNVKLPVKLDDRVQAYAKARGISVMAAITLLLDDALAGKTPTTEGK